MNHLESSTTVMVHPQPRSVEAVLVQARECSENQPQQAIDLIQSIQWHRLEPLDRAEGLWMHAKCLIRTGVLEDAKPCLAQAIEIFGQFNHPNHMTCRADLGRLYRDLGDPTRYVERFIVSSWADYLRQRDRAIVADQPLEARVRAYQAEGVPVQMQHYIAEL